MINKQMDIGELRNEVNDFLLEHKEGSLATSIGNIPRSSPVQYFVGKNMDIYILSAGGEKFKAIDENPNVCLLVNTDYINHRKIKGVQVFGKATTSLKDNSIFEEAKNQYEDNYILDKEKDNLKVIKVEPDEIVYLNSVVDGDRTKQVLRLNDGDVKVIHDTVEHKGKFNINPT
ncbi:pyridoxamine 5'-phosphate oxidase family protein [Wansuia hejianensis]|uniref:Pyridoxamine 5'-phosphate oxidase family protein n=1 Tax=Wansuia hejianensis TaxID=2763667 RepID=A0A926IGN4_9FIRM|nr:pyridoxamine 5'-phosphate oxidase family protein [Wansuia hejianensis]MBC8589767.1 pyridoxamine 5'-phosphate oxidase family protein [Wansuia hejianensis]